jgi:hypothetical protein
LVSIVLDKPLRSAKRAAIADVPDLGKPKIKIGYFSTVENLFSKKDFIPKLVILINSLAHNFILQTAK